MKNQIRKMVVTMALLTTLWPANGADKKHIGGPKGGRFLEKTEPRAEFFLEKDHTATITFYDTQLKPIPAREETMTIIAETKGGKKKIDFEKKGNVLVSKSPLPEGDDYNLVLQLKEKPQSKPRNFRFTLETNICGGCNRAEYACTCDE